MGEDRSPTRRRFLSLAGVGTATVLAGCGSGGDGNGTEGGTTVGSTPTRTATETVAETATEDSTPTATEEPIDWEPDFEEYPYGAGESRVERAREVMREAGYGPENPFELEWFTIAPASPITEWVDDHAAEVFVDATTEHANLQLYQYAKDGEVDALTIGSPTHDVPRPLDFLGDVRPPATDLSDEEAGGLPLFWTGESSHGPGREAAIEAFDRIERDLQDGDASEAALAEAYRRVERALWADVPLLTRFHGTTELLWRDELAFRPPGPMGLDYAKHNHSLVGIEGRDRVQLPMDDTPYLDPRYGWRNTFRVGNQVFDTLFGYPVGSVTPEPLLVSNHEVSEDGETHTFELKPGVQFHDGSELTAEDVVYTFRRLAEGEEVNYRVRQTLGIEADYVQGDRGGYRAKRGSLAVRAPGDYVVEMDLREPYYAVPEMLARPQFSVLPEGIVGDVPGYEGRMSAEEFRKRPVGAGPFAVDQVKEGEYEGAYEYLDLRRFEEYHGVPADVGAIRYRFGYGEEFPHEAFANGEVDLYDASRYPSNSGYDPGKVAVERSEELGRAVGTYGPLPDGTTANYARIPEVETWYVVFNCERVPLPVRRALAFLLDRSAILPDPHRPAYHLTPPSVFPGGREGYLDHFRG